MDSIHGERGEWMTKGEARELYLRYLGEATINGSVKADPDLRDLFGYLLPGALVQIAAAFPLHRQVEVTGTDWPVPADFWALDRVENGGRPVGYTKGEGCYRFAEPGAVVTYARMPQQPTPEDPDETVLDVLPAAAVLVPIRCAIDAAVSSEAHAYKVGYLSTTYDTLAASLQREDVPQMRRVMWI